LETFSRIALSSFNWGELEEKMYERMISTAIKQFNSHGHQRAILGK
jgi:hypothetical protein